MTLRRAVPVLVLVLVLVSSCSDPLGPPRLLDRDLPDAQVGLFYDYALRATDGRLPLRFRIQSGPLPPGIRLSIDGRLEGFPESPGVFTFRVVVTDASHLEDFADLSLHVASAGGPLAIPEQTPPRAFVDDVYAYDVETTGGIPPIRFAVVEGALPSGLSLRTDGRLEGTPTVAGTFDVTVEATDESDTARGDLSLVVGEHVDLVTDRLLPVELGAPVDVALETARGVPPYAYSVVRGDLPPGISVTPDGRVTGAGTEDGAFVFTVRVDDAASDFDEERYVFHVVDGLVRIDPVDVAIDDACELPGVEESVPFEATLDVARSGALTELDVYVSVEYADMGFIALVLTSPDGESVILHGWAGIGGAQGGLDTVYDEEDAPVGRLDVFAGDNPLGTWRLTAFVHRADEAWIECPGPGRIAAFGLLLRFDGSSEDYVIASGWTPNNLLADPTARIAGGGIEQSAFTMSLRRYTSGANAIREGGEGDDVDLGAVPVTWTTTLRPEQGTIGAASGTFQAGEETGRRDAEVEALGPGILTGDEGGGILHQFEVRVLAPDWVP